MTRLTSTTLIILVLAAAPLAAQPTFTKWFSPDTIGPGSISTLRFDIENVSGSGITSITFSDTLPAGVVIAEPASATTDCSEGVLTAPAGGSTISLSNAELGAGATCSVSVNVTSSTPGTHMNVSGQLTSSAGNSGTATDDLTVSTACPGFTKSFSPDSIATGQTSTLTFTLDNSANAGSASFLSFLDNLPQGVVVATPANASTDCSSFSDITANSGSSSVSFFDFSLGAGATCEVSVDVTATAAGSKENLTEALSLQSSTCGKAGATLAVERKFLTKLFPDDPVPPGGTVTLEFTIQNFDRVFSATDISFDDDLNATVPGLAAIGLPIIEPCGAGSQLSDGGANSLSFTGGSLGPAESCMFSVSLDVPLGAIPGTYTNTTSSVVVTVDGNVGTEDAATDQLVVAAVPLLSKSFLDDPVTAGDTVTLSFTITNSSPGESATDIAFEDVLIDGLPTASSIPADGSCGASSDFTFVPATDFDPPRLTLTAGSLAPGADCTFDFILDVAPSLGGGTYDNTTSPITATVGGEALEGNPATDSLQVVAAPSLRKEFTDDPVLPGDTVTLEFTLELPAEAPSNATAIAFTDDLDAVISGLAATGLPFNGVCGAGSQVSGTSIVSFSGGSLAPGASCTFGVEVQVPTGLLPGAHTNTTSEVSATSLGLAVASNAANADLEIAGLTFTKTFTDDPVLAGDAVTLEFMIDNLSASVSATSLTFSDDLAAVLDGLVAAGLPLANVCGAGSQLVGSAGNTFVTLTGGNLGPSNSCTFDLTLLTPGAADPGVYPNVTSQLSGSVGGSAVTVSAAADDLAVVEPLSISKRFLEDPVAPGDTVILEFTIANTGIAASATNLEFTDDLDFVLSDLVAVGLPTSNVCGAGSELSGTGFLSFSGGSLGPESFCTFQVTLQVPPSAPVDTTATNVTSKITGQVGGKATSGYVAIDQLTIELPMCLAANGEMLTLQSASVTDEQVVEVCDTVEIGPDYEILGPSGDLTVRAGVSIILKNGVSVTSGGTLRLGVDPNLQP